LNSCRISRHSVKPPDIIAIRIKCIPINIRCLGPSANKLPRCQVPIQNVTLSPVSILYLAAEKSSIARLKLNLSLLLCITISIIVTLLLADKIPRRTRDDINWAPSHIYRVWDHIWSEGRIYGV